VTSGILIMYITYVLCVYVCSAYTSTFNYLYYYKITLIDTLQIINYVLLKQQMDYLSNLPDDALINILGEVYL